MKKRGFTLIEMLIVIIIIGILAATLIPRIGNARDRANDVARVADVKSIATALTSYGLDHSSYPSAASGCTKNGDVLNTVLTGSDYGLGGVMPGDPINHTCYDYKPLDSGEHFVVCATLSATDSNNGNTSSEFSAFTNYTTSIGLLNSTNGSRYCYVG